MTRETTAAYDSANDAAHFDEVIFAELQFASGTSYVCTREHDVDWNSITWAGKGQVGTIEPIEEAGELEPLGIAMTLKVSAELLALALDPSEYKNRTAKIWRGLYGPDMVDIDWAGDPDGATALFEGMGGTITRSGATATRVNESGVIETVAADTLRIDYDPVTLECKGRLHEEARTNSIRNNTMQGAVAGTSGTVPTNWTANMTGLTRTVVGTGVENGIEYVELRFQGTTGATFGNIAYETSTGIACSNGQSWSHGVYLSLVGGDLTNVTGVRVRLSLNNSTPSYIGEVLTPPDIKGSLTSALQRFTSSGTIANASAAYMNPLVQFSWASGVAVDFTVRVGLPQCELGACPTSVIKTSSATVTRNGESLTYADISDFHNGEEGTILLEATLHAAEQTDFRRLVALTDGTSNERIDLELGTSGQSRLQVNDGGVSQVGAQNGSTIAGDTVFRAAAAYRSNDFAVSQDGTAVTTDAAGTLPTVSRLNVMTSDSGSGAQLCGHERRLTLYPHRLGNDVLEALSAGELDPAAAARGRKIVADPVGPFTFRMDSLEFELGRTGTLRLTAEGRLADWQRPRVRYYNDADQQAEYPGDNFFANTEEFVEKTLIW
jgi:hypothetical protein